VELLEDRLAAATLTVDSTADTANPSDPYLSLREAIALVNSPSLPSGLSDQILGQISGTLHAGASDTIAFDPAGVTSPIILGGRQLELTLPASTAGVTIDGGAGVTLDGNRTSRVFQVDGPVLATFQNLTITHGSDRNQGGGVSNLGTLTVSGSTITQNGTAFGGGVYNTGTLTVSNSALTDNGGGPRSAGAGIYNLGTLTLTGSTVSSNTAYSAGGLLNSGTATVTDCTFRGNDGSLPGAGAIANSGTLTVRRAAFDSNFGAGPGGGISNTNGGTATVDDSTFSGNSALTGGGAIDNEGATLTLSNSSLSGNSASGDGAISQNGGTLTVEDCTFESNTATDGGGALGASGMTTLTGCTFDSNRVTGFDLGGGAILSGSGTMTVTSCTVTANSTSRSGGEILALSGTVVLRNTIVAGNLAPTATAGPDISGAIDGSSSYNLIGIADGLPGLSNGANSNLLGTSTAPLDPRLGPLADNGGPTLTHALLDDSLARGAGSLDFATDTDQRGLPRVVGGETDLGSYQTQSAVAGPQVEASDPDGPTAPPVDHVRLTFNHPIDPTTFTPAQVSLTGPGGDIPVTGVAPVPGSNGQQLDISFGSLDPGGDYTLVVSASVQDTHGNSLGSPYTDRFSVFGLTGTVLTVNSTADTANDSDPYLSLREAIALVNLQTLPDDLSQQIRAQIGGPLHQGHVDTIVFDPNQVNGPITLAGTQLELSLPASTATVTIDGGPAGVTVDGNNASRVLQIDAGVQASLESVTILHGRTVPSENGGGISNAGVLAVSHCTIGSNSARLGGGIANTGGTLTLTDSTLTSNSAGYDGGGIEDSGPLTVSHCTLSSNSSDGAGGIGITAGTVTVTDSILQFNSASAGAGGIGNSGTLTVSNCTLTGNSAHFGGGIANGYFSTLTITGCTLASNSADDGGGILNDGTVTVSHCTLTDNGSGASSSFGGGISIGAGTLTVSDSTLTGNVADYGGGIYNDGTLTVSNCTLASNSGGVEGGGIRTAAGQLTVTNSTLTGNSSRAGGGIYNYSGSTPVQLRNTIVAGNSAGDTSGLLSQSHSLIGGNPGLAALGYYGGPTQTFALLPGSPALGAGDPASAPPTDQRGLPRLAGGPIDIGAFQSQAAPFLVTTLADPGQQLGLLSLREAVALANVLPGDNTVSFDPNRDGGAITLAAGQLELSGTGGVQTIDGQGRFTLDGGGATRLLQVDAGTSAVVRGFALLNGNASWGAGVYNQGTLTVADCVLYGNTAYSGGAILNQGALTLYGSTLAFNAATLGGAIDNEGMLTAYNTTIGYNAALASGGAILNQPTGTAILTSLTISLNSAQEGGGLDVAGGLVLLHNCIVAGNTNADGSAASDISGTVDSGSTYDLIGTGGSGGLTDGMNHNRVGVADPGLTPPDFSSNQTPAFGLSSDSPALGAGDPTLLSDPLLSLDQHGNQRSNPPNIGAL
jgi:hypothetical protein